MRYRLVRGLDICVVSGEVVLTLPSGDIIVLNESAAAIVGRLSRDVCDADDAACALEEAYGIDSDVSLRDARRTLAKLRSAGVIEPVRPHESASTSISSPGLVSRRAFVAGMVVAGAGLFATPRAFGAEAADRATCSFGGELVPVEVDGSKRTVVDSLGRRVSLPPNISRVAGFGPLALAMLRGIDPELVVHVSARGLHALPGRDFELAGSLSALSGGEGFLDTYMLEEEAPDLVLDIATSVERTSLQAEEAADRAGVPILHMVVCEDELAQAYRSLGRILDKARAFELADMAARIQTTLAQGREEAKAIGERAVYFGTGVCGLSTRGNGTLLNAVVSSLGARNVAAELTDEECREVSVSRIMEWGPDIAVVAPVQDSGESLQNEIVRKLWARLAEIGRFNLRHAPTLEFDWVLNSPLALMTFGALWLARAVYPEVYDYDVEAVANDCIDAFFGQETAAFNVESGTEALLSASVEADKLGFAAGSLEEDGYASPLVDVISADILNSTRSYMSSGGGSGGGGTPTPITYINACLLFSGIMTSGIDTTLDHTALLLHRSDGADYFYSFAADGSDFVAAITGTDGYYSTAVSHNGNVASNGIKARISMSYSYLYQYGEVFTDWIGDRNGHYDIGYYRMIRIPISDTVGQSMAAYAQSFRLLCKYCADENTGYGSSNGITTEYSLLDHNCFDTATEILGLLGYEVIYSNTGAYARLAAVCAVLTAANIAAGAVLAGYIAARVQTGTMPSVPNCAYTDLVRIDRNGSVVCYATDEGVKDEFRSRGSDAS